MTPKESSVDSYQGSELYAAPGHRGPCPWQPDDTVGAHQ